MPTTVTRGRLRVPTWLLAALAGAAIATAATVLVEGSSGSSSGPAAVHGSGVLSQPSVCIQTTPTGPGHC